MMKEMDSGYNSCIQTFKSPHSLTPNGELLLMTQNKVAEILLDLGCVQFNFDELFTYTSGIKSPIYTNCRLIISYPEERKIIADLMAKYIKHIIPNYKDYLICGLISAGVPHAAWVAEILKIGLTYKREERKDYGLRTLIEGKKIKNIPMIIIEDHITTGSSIIREAKGLREEGGIVSHAFSIFTYNLKKSEEISKQNGLTFHSLCSIGVLLDLAVKRKKITIEQKNKVLQWRDGQI